MVDEQFDFVVIGSGGGSMAAALLMRSLGKSVLILEKTEFAGGTTARSGGVMWIPANRYMKAAGIKDSAEDAVAYLDAIIGDDPLSPGATPARRRAYVAESNKMLEFLIGEGLRFRRVPVYPDYYSHAPGAHPLGRTLVSELFDTRKLGPWASKLRPTFLPFPAPLDEVMQLPWMKRSWKARWFLLKMIRRMAMGKLTGRQLVTAGNALQGAALHAVLERGAEVRLESPVTEILTENGRVTGVVTVKDGKPWRVGATLGVLINAGGFSRNQAMRDRYLPGTSAGWTNTGSGDTGEMIEEGLRLGGTVAQTDTTVGALIAVPPGETPLLPMLQGDAAKPHAIMVDQTGRRYLKESGSYVDLCYSMMTHHNSSPDAKSWLVIDAQFAEKYGFMGSKGTKMRAGMVESGFIKTGDTLDALATACGLDAATLKATVERYNGFARKGHDEDFGRGGSDAYQESQGDPFHQPSHVMGPLEKGPYFAVEVFPGDVSTFGGLVTDDQARVLREDGSVIDGLYATGTSTASSLGRREPAPGGSVGPSFVWGYVAAKHAAHAGNRAG